MCCNVSIQADRSEDINQISFLRIISNKGQDRKWLPKAQQILAKAKTFLKGFESWPLYCRIVHWTNRASIWRRRIRRSSNNYWGKWCWWSRRRLMQRIRRLIWPPIIRPLNYKYRRRPKKLVPKIWTECCKKTRACGVDFARSEQT